MVEQLLTAVLVVLVVLIALWGINTLVGFDPQMKRAINVLIVVALAVWLVVWLFRLNGVG